MSDSKSADEEKDGANTKDLLARKDEPVQYSEIPSDRLTSDEPVQDDQTPSPHPHSETVIGTDAVNLSTFIEPSTSVKTCSSQFASPSSSDDSPKVRPGSFDRLKPRNSGDLKRTLMADDDRPKKVSAKKEYCKLRRLVPALNEREDLSKVEIIEETIRYIDALHHQLASQVRPGQEEEEVSQATNQMCSPPVQPLGDSSSDGPSTQQRRPAAPSSSFSSSSSQRSSTQDVKAAVENIQAMFAAYLEQNPGQLDQ